MIDIHQERIIPLSAVPRHLPKRTSGKKIHISAVYRWTSRGVRGIVLESIKIGGCTYTSLEALQRFSEHLTSKQPRIQSVHSVPISRKRQIDHAIDQVNNELGIPRIKAARKPKNPIK